MKKYSIIIVIIIFALIVYSLLIEPSQVVITQQKIYNSALARLIGDKVVVQLSDLHISKSGRREQKVLEIINSLKPDYIFLTGDYVSWDASYNDAFIFLSKLNAKVGVWGVLGDYDYNKSRQSCLFCHLNDSNYGIKKNGIHFLKYDFAFVKANNQLLRIGGVDNYQMVESKMVNFRNQISIDLPTILLCHNPLLFDKIESKSEFVMLSGDTHGGQFPLPSFLWQWMGYDKNWHYNYGLYKRDNHQLFVSRGIGYSHLPIRFMRKPEVVVLKFVDYGQ